VIDLPAGSTVIHNPTGLEFTVLAVVHADTRIPFVWCDGLPPSVRQPVSIHQLTIKLNGDRLVMTKPKSIKLKDIIVDDKFQMRSGGLDEHHVAELQAVIGDGGQFKDPIVVFDIDSLNYHLVDGFHRFEAATREGWRSIKATIYEGTEAEAIVYAEEANLQHGLALSTQDRKDILFNRFQRGHLETLKTGEQVEWSRLSNAFLAALLGVSERTITNWVELYQRESGGQNFPPVDRDEVYGRDGKLYNTQAVKDANRARADDTPVTDSANQGSNDTEPDSVQEDNEPETIEARAWRLDDGKFLGETRITPDEFAVLETFASFSKGWQYKWLPSTEVFPRQADKWGILNDLEERGLLERKHGTGDFRPIRDFNLVESTGVLWINGDFHTRHKDDAHPVTEDDIETEDAFTPQEDAIYKEFMAYFESRPSEEFVYWTTIFSRLKFAMEPKRKVYRETLQKLAELGLIELDSDKQLFYRPAKTEPSSDDGTPAQLSVESLSYDLTPEQHEMLTLDGLLLEDIETSGDLAYDEAAVLQMVEAYYAENDLPTDKYVLITKFFSPEDALFRYRCDLLRELAERGYVEQSGTSLFRLPPKTAPPAPVATTPSLQLVPKPLADNDGGFEASVLSDFAAAWQKQFDETGKDWLDHYAVFGGRNMTDQARRSALKVLVEKGYVARHTIKNNHYRLLTRAMETLNESSDATPLDTDPAQEPHEAPDDIDLPEGHSLSPIKGSRPPATSNHDDNGSYFIAKRGELEKAIFDLQAAMKVILARKDVTEWGALGRTALIDTAKLCTETLKVMPECQTHLSYIKHRLLQISDEIAFGDDHSP